MTKTAASSFRAVPRTAIVLAAGLGMRMRPLTLERPKPLLPVAGRTLLDRAIDRLEAAGVETVVVNSHYKGEMIADHLADRHTPRIVLSPETEPLETGGGIRKALPHLGDETFLAVNADTLWLDGPTPAIARLARTWNPEVMDALLLMMATTRAFGYDGCGDYLMDPDGRLRRRPEHAIVPFVYAGVQILKPALFADTPDGAFSNTLIWDRAQAAGRLYGMAHDGAWFHVGTPGALAETDGLIGGGMVCRFMP